MNISAVVLSYGYQPYVLDCLMSLDKVDGREYLEIILVDNGSPQMEREQLEHEIAAHNLRIETYVRLDQNQGFASGMNAGLKVARGDLVLALNSDTLVGRRIPLVLQSFKVDNQSKVGFLAVPIYDWGYGPERSEATTNWQADVVALTCYLSCLPVRRDRLREHFILGPPGSAVIMTRQLIDDFFGRFGAIYDPHFFLYGEDVDLFLRARQLGYVTHYLPGDPSKEEVIWHIGSASITPGVRDTLSKSPQVARLIIDAFLDNAIHHSAVMELPIVLLLQVAFRMSFYFLYARKNSIEWLLELWFSRSSTRPSRLPGLSRRWGFWLLPQMALLYRSSPLPWAFK